jgi:hypothetical protein
MKQSKMNNFSMKSGIKFIFFLCSLFLFMFCNHKGSLTDIKDASPYFTAFFTGKEDAVLRDINFNMTIDEVKKTEPSRLYEATTDHLFYEFSFPTDSTAFSEYANIQYSFNENNQLDVITNNIYLNDTFQQQKLKNNLLQYYNQRFGESEINSNKDEVWKGVFKDKITTENYGYTVSVINLEDDQDINAIGLTIEYYLQR